MSKDDDDNPPPQPTPPEPAVPREYIPEPPSPEATREISRQQALITDEWSGEPPKPV